MRKNMIVAHDMSNLIGLNDEIPWHYSEDMKYFKKVTTGNGNNFLVFGRKTYQGIIDLGIKLKNRKIIVLSKDSLSFKKYENPEVFVCTDITDTFRIAEEHNADNVFICGGEEIYKYFFDKIDFLYTTLVITNIFFEPLIQTPHYFPQITNDKFELIEKFEHQNGDLVFRIYVAKQFKKEFEETNLNIPNDKKFKPLQPLLDKTILDYF
jgi:dihydrofolate reductase